MITNERDRQTAAEEFSRAMQLLRSNPGATEVVTDPRNGNTFTDPKSSGTEATPSEVESIYGYVSGDASAAQKSFGLNNIKAAREAFQHPDFPREGKILMDRYMAHINTSGGAKLSFRQFCDGEIDRETRQQSGGDTQRAAEVMNRWSNGYVAASDLLSTVVPPHSATLQKDEQTMYGQVPTDNYMSPIRAGGAAAGKDDEKDGWGTWLKKNGPMGAALAGAAMGFSSGGLMGAIVGFLIGMIAGNVIMNNTPVGDFIKDKVNGLTGGKGKSPELSPEMMETRAINANKDGVIDKKELEAGIESILKKESAEAVQIAGELLKQFDKSKDAKLDTTELSELAKQMQEGKLTLPEGVTPADIKKLLAPQTPAGTKPAGAHR